MKKTKTKTAQQPVTFSSIMGEPKTRDEVLQQIRKNDRTYQKFLNMPFFYQDKLLGFLCGKRGLEIVYDPFFQHIFHPDHHPERLENFVPFISTTATLFMTAVFVSTILNIYPT